MINIGETQERKEKAEMKGPIIAVVIAIIVAVILAGVVIYELSVISKYQNSPEAGDSTENRMIVMGPKEIVIEENSNKDLSDPERVVRDCLEMIKTGDLATAEAKYFDDNARQMQTPDGFDNVSLSQRLIYIANDYPQRQEQVNAPEMPGAVRELYVKISPQSISGNTAYINIDHGANITYNNNTNPIIELQFQITLFKSGSDWKIHDFNPCRE